MTNPADDPDIANVCDEALKAIYADPKGRLIGKHALYKYDGIGDVHSHILHSIVNEHNSLTNGEMELYEHRGDRWMLIHHVRGIYHGIPLTIDNDGVRFYGIAEQRSEHTRDTIIISNSGPVVLPLCDPNLTERFFECIRELIGQWGEI